MPAPPNAPTTPTVEVRIDVPAALHRQVKVRAAQDGLTVKGAMLAALDDWVTPAKHRARSTAELDQARAEGARAAYDMFKQGAESRDMPGAQRKVLAYIKERNGPSDG